jgi:hypothetical protein
MPRYQFTYLKVIRINARVNAENEQEAIEVFEESCGYEEEFGVSEVQIEEGNRLKVEGPTEVFELQPHDYGPGLPNKIAG